MEMNKTDLALVPGHKSGGTGSMIGVKNYSVDQRWPPANDLWNFSDVERELNVVRGTTGKTMTFRLHY